jgi:hypothetical protein
MLNHVVLIELNEGVTDEQVDAILEGLAALPPVISQIRSYEYGRNAGLSPNSVDLAIVAKFDSAEDFATYRDHPAHQAFGRDLLLPLSKTRTVAQFFSEG